MQYCWRHNLATALVARRIAGRGDVDCDHAYMAGLLHDLGRLVLLTVHPREYNRLIANSNEDAALTVRDAERQAFGIDHCDTGEWLINEWKLPTGFANAARDHLNDGDLDPLSETVRDACSIARRLGFGPEGRAAKPEDISGLPPELAFQIGDAVNHLECEFGLTGIVRR